MAVLGVIAPMILGWGVGWWLIPEAGSEVHAFIGATLCAAKGRRTRAMLLTGTAVQQLGRGAGDSHAL